MPGRIFALLLFTIVGRGFAAESAPGPPAAEPLVFAAASLTDVLQQVAADYRRESGRSVKLSFGSTATLARQIESGARADVFVSADREWMEYLDQRALIRRPSRRDLVGNRLVLVAPADSALQLELRPGMALRGALGVAGRLSIADPASVPAGKYAKAAVTALGAWHEVESRIVVSDNVRTALAFVARGEAPLGIVYLTDAKAEPRVRVVAEFPASTHPPIVYPATLTTTAGAEGAAFLDYLSGRTARLRFAAAGFAPFGEDGAPVAACRIGDWNMTAEWRLFQGEPRRVAAAKSAGSLVPDLETGRLWAIQLFPQAEVKFAAAPSRSLLAEGSFAGMARFRVPKSGRYRVTVDGPFWIDVFRGDQPFASVDFGGRHECPLFRKSIEYDLPAGETLTLQLGGAARREARVTILPAAHDAGARQRP